MPSNIRRIGYRTGVASGRRTFNKRWRPSWIASQGQQNLCHGPQAGRSDAEACRVLPAAKPKRVDSRHNFARIWGPKVRKPETEP